MWKGGMIFLYRLARQRGRGRGRHGSREGMERAEVGEEREGRGGVRGDKEGGIYNLFTKPSKLYLFPRTQIDPMCLTL